MSLPIPSLRELYLNAVCNQGYTVPKEDVGHPCFVNSLMELEKDPLISRYVSGYDPNLSEWDKLQMLHAQLRADLRRVDPQGLDVLIECGKDVPRYLASAIQQALHERVWETISLHPVPGMPGPHASFEEVQSWLDTDPDLSSVTHLDLRDLQLHLIPVILSHFTHLTSVNLSGNEIAEIPPGFFQNFPMLSCLYLSKNALTVLDEGVFAGLSDLTGLWLDHNKLDCLPLGVFDGLDQLLKLDLNDNFLDALPEGLFSPLKNLRALYLSRNQLNEIPAGLFFTPGGGELLPHLEYLALYDNPSDFSYFRTGFLDLPISEKMHAMHAFFRR